jgi:hypothetical protein
MEPNLVGGEFLIWEVDVVLIWEVDVVLIWEVDVARPGRSGG